MVTVERVTEIAAQLRGQGGGTVADDLANAHIGVFNGTELAMKWRFYLAEALKLGGLTATTREQVEQAWRELEDTLS